MCDAPFGGKYHNEEWKLFYLTEEEGSGKIARAVGKCKEYKFNARKLRSCKNLTSLVFPYKKKLKYLTYF